MDWVTRLAASAWAALASSISVSYTHLDVYKRQVLDLLVGLNKVPDIARSQDAVGIDSIVPSLSLIHI